MKQLPIIQSLWIGDDLTNLEKLCIQSFLDNGHEFHLYTYAEIGGIPVSGGLIVKDGNEILPEKKIFQCEGGSYAAFADWFRYALLTAKGGAWVDMDMVCLKPFDFGYNAVFFAGDNEVLCTTAVIGAPTNHPLMVAMMDECNAVPNKDGCKWGAVGGPRVLSETVAEMGYENSVKPFYYFMPLTASQWYLPLDKTFAESTDFFSGSYAIHLYNEMLRKAGLDKNARFDSESLFEKLKAKHSIENTTLFEITPADVKAKVALRENVRIERKSKEKKLLLGVVLLIGVLVVGNVIGWIL